MIQAKNRELIPGEYYESHHIVPDFMFKNRKRKGPRGHLDGDPNSPDNVVKLTFREHLMAHYYFYEMQRGTHYEHPAGSALQFFFVKATGNHMRQRTLSEVDDDFLKEMEHLRKIGINSISAARTGKFPAVDAITRESVGSVSRDHPKVLSGEWIHHSKGVPGKKQPLGYGVGSANKNYREMTPDRMRRVLDVVSRSTTSDGHVMFSKFKEELVKEFTEFKKVSYPWVFNNVGNMQNLVKMFNEDRGQNLVYETYYRSPEHRNKSRHQLKLNNKRIQSLPINQTTNIQS